MLGKAFFFVISARRNVYSSFQCRPAPVKTGARIQYPAPTQSRMGSGLTRGAGFPFLVIVT